MEVTQLMTRDSIAKKYEHVYVSPHMDDVVMSCGGRIIAQRKANESVLVVTVFTDHVNKQIRSKALAGFTNVQERKEEDRRAMKRLAVDYIWLNHPEAIYRDKKYQSLHGIISRVAKSDSKLCMNLLSDITEILKRTGSKNLYLPMGVGNHIDHQILFQIGAKLREAQERHFDIYYYEDIPYVFVANLLKYRMKLIGIDGCITESASQLGDDKSYGKGRARRKWLGREIVETCRSAFDIYFMKTQIRNPILKTLLFFYATFNVLLAVNLFRRKETLSNAFILPEVYDISSVLGEKIKAVAEYRSQIALLFGDLESFKTRMAKYSKAITGLEGRYIERYWRIAQQ